MKISIVTLRGLINLLKTLHFMNKKLFNEIKYRPSNGLSEIVKNLNN